MLFKPWIVIFFGFCMGIADLIPGISGGTIAFVLGFYEPLMESLKSINRSFFTELLKGDWKSIVGRSSVRFLFYLLLGVFSAFLFFSRAIHTLLKNETGQMYLYAIFFGLVIASFVFCLKKIKKWNFWLSLLLLSTTLLSYLLTGSVSAPSSSFDLESPLVFLHLWLFFCGMVGICALLLPGISGSYLLILLGVYPLVIEALVHFTEGLRFFAFDLEAFMILASLGLGVLCGALFFGRCINLLLKNYPDITLTTLSGFMLGGLRTVWPFKSFEEGIVVNLSISFFILCSVFLLFVLEKSAQKLRLEQN